MADHIDTALTHPVGFLYRFSPFNQEGQLLGRNGLSTQAN